MIVVYVYSSIVLGHGSYRELVSTTYAQQQPNYYAYQALCVVAMLQLLMLVLVFLVTIIILCFSGKWLHALHEA